MSSDLSLQYDIFVFSSITNLFLVKKTNLFFFTTDFTVYDGYLFLGNLFSTDLLTQKFFCFFRKQICFHLNKLRKQIGRFGHF